MGVYAVTGSASGMGQAAADKLRAAGHTVIGVDIQEAEVVADLSTQSGRGAAARDVLHAADGHLDGAVVAAGLGPVPGPDAVRKIAEVNYFGAVELLEAWRPALARAQRAKVVVFSSNSTTTTPLVPRRTIRALLDHAPEKAVRSAELLRALGPIMIYAGSKIALSQWVRTRAVRPEWAGSGIRLNALAPGAILTPLLQRQLSDPAEAKAVESFPIPIGRYGDPQHVADWVRFLLSDSADFLVGSIIFLDGGSDAYLRPRGWPQPVRIGGLLGYVRRMKSFAADKNRSGTTSRAQRTS